MLLRILDIIASPLVVALGVMLLWAQAEDVFAGYPLDHPWARLLIFALSVACVWLGWRTPLPTKERA